MTTATDLPEITADWLLEHRACADQVDLFAEVFGAGMKLTRANIFRAAGAGLRVGWLPAYILDGPAFLAYIEATMAARMTFHDRLDRAWQSHGMLGDLRAFEEAIAPAWRAHDRAMAVAFCDALGLERSHEEDA